MSQSEIRLAWHRSRIDREVLAKLTKRENLRPLFDVVLQLAISVGSGAFAFWAFRNAGPVLVVIALYLHCSLYGFFGGGTFGHELSHGTVFASHWLNELFIRVNGFLTWFDFVYFRRSHAGHHQYTLHDDLDMEVTLPMNLRWYQWIYSFTANPLAIYRLMKTIARRGFGVKREKQLITEWEKRIFPATDLSAIRALKRWNRVLLLGHLGLAVLFVASGNWILLFIVTFAPFFASWFKLLTHMPQHIGMRSDIADWRQSTRSYLAGPIVRFYYWNMNYHIEHHMYAAVPYYHLPELHRALEGDLPIASRGLIATWREILETVRRQRRDASYCYVPPLPAGATPYR